MSVWALEPIIRCGTWILEGVFGFEVQLCLLCSVVPSSSPNKPPSRLLSTFSAEAGGHGIQRGRGRDRFRRLRVRDVAVSSLVAEVRNPVRFRIIPFHMFCSKSHRIDFRNAVSFEIYSNFKWVRRIVSGEAGQATPGKYVASTAWLWATSVQAYHIFLVQALGVLVQAYHIFLVVRASGDRVRACRSLVVVLLLVGVYAATVFAFVPASTTNAPDSSNGRMLAFGVAGIASSTTVQVVAFMHLEELEACASVAFAYSWFIYGMIHRDPFFVVSHTLGMLFMLCQVPTRDGNAGRWSTLNRHIRHIRGHHDPDL